MTTPALLLLSLLAAAPGGELPVELEGLVHAGPLGHSHSGIEVICLETGEVVYASGASDLLNPASNTKIFTSAAALVRLGPDYRWLTEVYLEAPLVHGSVHGDLVLRGKGDPTLISERLWELAGELWHEGLREVRGDLVLDDSYFDGVVEGPGWDQEQTDRAYLAPISALASNWGSFAIYASPGERVGQRARVDLEPASPYFKLENQLTTSRAGGSKHLVTSGFQARDGYHVRVSGRIALGAPTTALWRRVGDPTRYTGETFRQLLAQRGIRITGRVRRGIRSAHARLLHASESDGLDIVLKRLNKQSSNFIAEMLVKTLAAEAKGVPGTWANGIEAIKEFLAQDVGIPRGSYVMKNGSGLNDVNRFSAAQVVRVLAYMYPRMTVAPEYLSSLGIAARDGTVRFRMTDTPAAGRVRAKTGTLEDVSALSGYVESVGGRHYAFSLLVNDYPSSLRRAVAAEDAFAVALASAGSGGGGATSTRLPESADDPTARRERAKRYFELEQQPDVAEVPGLRAALRDETDPALRSIAAEALYEADADAPETAEALVDALPGSAPELAQLLALASAVGAPVPLVPSLSELASDGDPRGFAGLIGLAALDPGLTGDGGAAWAAAVEEALGEVALQAPRELLSALAAEERTRAMKVVGLLVRGLEKGGEARARFGEALAASASGPPDVATFAKLVETRLPAETSKGAADAGAPIESLVNPAVPRHSPSGRGG